MGTQWLLKRNALFLVFLICMSVGIASSAMTPRAQAMAIEACLQAGWQPLYVKVAGRTRSVLLKRPHRIWKKGAIVILHGTGAHYHQFCAGGESVEPQIAFAQQAVEDGFAVFLLDATDGLVRDEAEQQCDKSFDFSVLARPNLDLHFIGKMVKTIIPQFRSGRSSEKIFLTGVSTGGYMVIRAATHFNSKITAFAPVAAGDPYSTRINCRKKIIKGKTIRMSLIDLETNKLVGIKKACLAQSYSNEKKWPRTNSKRKPVFKQFHSKGDAVVDISCMKKINKQLRKQDYQSKGMLLLGAKHRQSENHLWQERYNDAILDFFKKQ